MSHSPSQSMRSTRSLSLMSTSPNTSSKPHRSLQQGAPPGPRAYLSCDPCVDRTSLRIKVIVHGTSDDPFWIRLEAAARQAAMDMRVGHLDLELYPPGRYTEEKMVADIRAVAAAAAADEPSDSRVDALVVSIPSELVVDAVRYAAGKGVPVFGLNSGYQAASGPGGLIGDGSLLFFASMNERLGGEEAAAYFLRVLGHEAEAEAAEADTEADTSASTNAANATAMDSSTSMPPQNFTNALFVSPRGELELNSAYRERYEGFRDRLLAGAAFSMNSTSGNNNVHTSTNTNVDVELFQVDASSVDTLERGLEEKLSGCNYQAVLLGSGRLISAAVRAIEANGCDIRAPGGAKALLLATFDASADAFNLVAARRVDLVVDQHSFMQGWAPVHFAALFASTGLALSPPSDTDGVYLSGPALFSIDNLPTDSLRICSEAAFPVCPNRNGPDGVTPSDCPCTERSRMRIGGVVHGIKTSRFWDPVFAAAAQGAEDMGVDLDLVRFDPQEDKTVLYRKMSAKILSLCQEGVDGIFVSMPSPIVVDAVRTCTELKVPVVSINAGFDESAEMELIHHVGMVEYDAGRQAGERMASMAAGRLDDGAFCLDHRPGQKNTADRCSGFREALEGLGISYLGTVDVHEDNVALFKTSVEQAVGDPGDWDGYGFLLAGASQLPAALELKKSHPSFVMGSFDTDDLLYEAIEAGNLLFGIDQQAYLQGYLPLPILTYAAITKQTFLNHAIQSGPSFVLSKPSQEQAVCEAGAFLVCPEQPEENFNYVNDGIVITFMVLFGLQALLSLCSIGWLARHRKARVVRASQPEFLVLVAVGALVMASAILPLSVEGEYRFEQDAITRTETDVPNEDIGKVDAACMAVPWLVSIGFVLIYSALFAKLRRINEIVQKAEQMRRATVPKKSVAITIGCFFSVMVVIMLTWQFVSPLRWERVVTEIDNDTGYPTESFGKCTSEHQVAFVSTCACYFGVCLIYCLNLSYKTRDMSLEYSESKYIAMSVFFLFQLLLLGIPILVIAQDNTDAHFFVLSLIIFLMSFGTSVLIFAPKVMLHYRPSPSEAVQGSVHQIRMSVAPAVSSVEQIRRNAARRSQVSMLSSSEQIRTNASKRTTDMSYNGGAESTTDSV